MKLERKQKIQKREKRAKRQDAKLREDFARIFETMGIELDLRRLPEPAQYLLLSSRFPHPSVIVDIEHESPERLEELCSAVVSAIENTTFQMPAGYAISAPDFFRYCVALRDWIAMFVKHRWAGRFASQFQDAKVKFDALCSHVQDRELHRLLFEIDMALCPFTRINSAIYWYTATFKRNEIGKAHFVVTVHKTKAQTLRIASDRGARTAYRCGGSLGLHGQCWSRLSTRLFGVESDGYYPVYIQDHAIIRLHERLPMPGWEGEVHDSMWLSFIEPKMTLGPSGDRLIEYRFFGYKLGYFPVELVDGKVLIRTFLFLTMTGTPEARLLYKNFGLMRKDIEELSFDSIETFHYTDVVEDQELRALLTRCGCGHLLEMIKPEERTELKRGRAREIRHYLGMKAI